MKPEIIKKAKAEFQSNMRQLNDSDYPALGAQNNALVLLYAKIMELEDRIAKKESSVKYER